MLNVSIRAGVSRFGIGRVVISKAQSGSLRSLHGAIATKEDKKSNSIPPASTSDDLQRTYPGERPIEHVNHSTAGSTQGRRQARTLASFTLENKVCVITGAARGLGNVFARAFAESGCTSLAILDLKQGEVDAAARELAEWLETNEQPAPTKIEVVGYGCNVSEEDEVKSVFQEVVDRWGRIDALVTSAGIVENFAAFDYPTSKIKRLYDINVHGSFFCAREAAKHMVKTGTKGSIVLVASMSANIVNVPQPQTPYNGSKAAVKHMASSLAVEWAQHGIRVNALSPGYMLTSLTKTILEKNEELKRTWVNLTPMARMGDPDDLKGAIVYLASDASKFTTGTELRVDGGYTIV